MAQPDPLQEYKSKRDFAVTPEPSDLGAASDSYPVFVVQKHWARRLHYDFRLELGDTMKSWAVPKGPSLDPRDKRMAVHVEDHPLSYNTFEGQIPKGHYGAGKVIVWDHGVWESVGDPHAAYKKGKITFQLHGQKLQGRWALIRMKGKSEKQDPWLLIKEKDDYARPAAEYSVVDEQPDSVLPQLTSPTPSHPSRPRAQSPQAIAADLPATLTPQLATLSKEPPPDSENWLFELKFDGYRLLTRVQGKDVILYTRNGHDWSSRLPDLRKRLKAMALPDGWYDGEIIVLNKNGIPDFQLLQNAFESSRTKDVDYVLFDLPFCKGHDLRDLPLTQRRAQLAAVLDEHHNADGGNTIRLSDTFEASARDLLASACRLGLEGMIAKRRDSPYVSHRSSDWLKLKCELRQEFVIAGYTAPQGSRRYFGSLLLGLYGQDGTLHYAGNVGSGFSVASLKTVHQALQAHRSNTSPFAADTTVPYRDVTWVTPAVVAEVSFASWTRGGHVRHAVFHALRSDKPARDVTREAVQSPETIMARSPSLSRLLDQQKISNPDRVIDTSTKTTKIDLVRYYALVAPLIMPHLDGRPVSFLRAPDGVGEKMFFQKHMTSGSMDGVHELPRKLDPDHDPLMEIAEEQGLLSAAQMNVVEFHTWNAVKTAIARPDRMVFDLDPGKGCGWQSVQEAALLMQAFLVELELVPFIKTSGGKGLHVVVPLQRRHDWDAVKDFSRQVVQHLATTFPKRFTAKSGPRNRVGKIFIDYLRNGFGATTVCAWSARARPGMAVSVPLDWREVESLSAPDRWRVANIHERLDVGNEPWQDYEDSARTLTAARRILAGTK